MKNKFQKTLLAFAFLLVANCLIAQAPQGIPYQAVARDNAGNLIKNQNIALRFSIHDGTATGPVVFTETHSVTTDALGLFAVNIGGGTSSGPLADVNWGSGAKFTQVELDVSGSSNYIDMGTTQMMSVPYALYAGNGNSVSMMGAIGQSSSSKGATITSGVLSLTPADATNGGVVTTEAQTIAGSKTFSSAIKITAGTPGAGKVLTSDAAGLASWESASACGYAIGQNVTALGGIIFYLDASGCHGLVCAPTDQSTGIRWNNGSYPNTTAFADCVGGGAGNTSMIIYNQGGTNSGIAHSFAAGLARTAYNGGAFSDWYLPSKYELNLMYNYIGQGNVLGLGNVGGFANSYYWSSTENDYYNAWYQHFGNGGQWYYYKNWTFYVRAVRAF
jgi:hypothetical protein